MQRPTLGYSLFPRLAISDGHGYVLTAMCRIYPLIPCPLATITRNTSVLQARQVHQHRSRFESVISRCRRPCPESVSVELTHKGWEAPFAAEASRWQQPKLLTVGAHSDKWCTNLLNQIYHVFAVQAVFVAYIHQCFRHLVGICSLLKVISFVWWGWCCGS